MGVCFVSFSATDGMIEAVHRNPPLIWRLYSPEDVDFYLSEIGADKKPSLLAKLFGKKEVAKPDPLPSFEYIDGERFDVDLDKSWDGINFCLKKVMAKGVPNIFVDGSQVGNIEVGYGPASTFNSSQVKSMYEAYKGISVNELVRMLNPSEMAGVYPKAIWHREDEETKEYVSENYEGLKGYLDRASGLGLGIVVVYT